MYAVITDRTPNRCTIASTHARKADAEHAAKRLDTGINGMPAEVMRAHDEHAPGTRAYHDGRQCWVYQVDSHGTQVPPRPTC